MPIIQAVLFDLGGTLLHYEQPPDNTFEAMNGRALRAFLKVAMERGVRVADPDLAIRAVARMGAALEASGWCSKPSPAAALAPTIAPACAASSRAPEMKSLCRWVSSTCVSRTPSCSAR
ncbi:MAG: hypothetical protein ACM30E_02255 [Nitrososphaerales archaeon]